MSGPQPENLLDLPLALSRVGGDIELLREIAILFIEECPRSITEIQEAIAGAEAPKLENAAHAIKGSVANFGAREAVEAAFQLEQMGRARQLSGAEPILRKLEGALAEVCRELAKI
jgi:HPt (histidine-containing phosphotransfer) domain-containing protein